MAHVRPWVQSQIPQDSLVPSWPWISGRTNQATGSTTASNAPRNPQDSPALLGAVSTPTNYLHTSKVSVRISSYLPEEMRRQGVNSFISSGHKIDVAAMVYDATSQSRVPGFSCGRKVAESQYTPGDSTHSVRLMGLQQRAEVWAVAASCWGGHS